MATTTFVNGVTLTDADWFNDVDRVVYDILADPADAAAIRTSLSLVIGTNVQAFDATLTAFAALTIAADSLTIGTGADAFSQTTFAANTFPAKASTGSLVAKTITDFGLSLIDDATAATACTTLGLGTGNSPTFTGLTLTGALTVGTVAGPDINDGAALGSATVSWSDLFLASGALINFANGNAVITHSSGILTVSTGDLRVTTAGTNTASAVTVGGTQTLTAKTLTSPTITTSPTAAGSTWTNLGTVTTADINGGTVDGAVIGGASAAAGTFTTLTATGNTTLGDALSDTTTITGDLTMGGGTILQNSQSAAYTTVAADANKHILHPTADNNARTFTIDSNANVAYAIGTAITFVNQINVVSIAITTDTMTLAGAGTTGTRTLAASGIATALKIASTSWIISGTGLS